LVKKIVMDVSEIDPKAVAQKIDVPVHAYKFITPCAIRISGPQQSGKSTFIVRLIKHRKQLFTQDFVKCFYCQPSNLCIRPNPIYEEIQKYIPNTELICGIPDVSKLGIDLDNSCKLLILDDLMLEILNSESIVKLLSVDVHHSNCTCILTVHNYYASSRHAKTITRNLNYEVLFYNRLDLREIKIISSQIGGNPNFLQECFTFLMKKIDSKHPYILLDGHTQSKMNSLHVRSNIFPENDETDGEIRPIVFFPK